MVFERNCSGLAEGRGVEVDVEMGLAARWEDAVMSRAELASALRLLRKPAAAIEAATSAKGPWWAVVSSGIIAESGWGGHEAMAALALRWLQEAT